MPGTTIPLFTKREFDFVTVAGVVIAIRSLDVSAWTEGVLQVRVHANSITTTGLIDVIATPISNTGEEPSVDYLAAAASATASVGIIASFPAGTLVTDTLTTGFGGAVQIKVKGTAGGVVKATLSAELVMKS